MTVAVLGASGYLGAWTTRALAALGHEVIAVVRPDSDVWRLEGSGARSVRRDPHAWAELVGETQLECVVMMGWEGVASADRDREDIQAGNVALHQQIARVAFRTGVSRFVGVGSQAEYGAVGAPYAEEARPRPATAYARAKVAAHAAVRREAEAVGAEHLWARVFSVFGPLETGDFILPTIARAAASGTTVALSSGRRPWSYLYASDAADALGVLVESHVTGVVNVAHPEAPSLRSSLSAFAAALGADGTLLFGDHDNEALSADTTRLRSLGWAPRVSVQQGMRITAEWMSGSAVGDPYNPGRDLPLQR